MSAPERGSARPADHPTAGDGGSVLAGIDAGGSHTTAVIADRTLTILGRATGGPGAITPGAVERSADAIRGTLNRVLRNARIGDSPAVLVVGAAGAGRAAEREALTRALDGCAGRIEVTTDGVVALESTFGTGPGIVVVAGTGSIAYARNAAGTVWRVGGLGWQLGDEGSGYALGRAALSAVGKALDRRGRGTALTEPVIAAAGCGSLDELVGWAAAASRDQIAALATVACEAAAGGDAVAQRLVGEAANELAGHVRALRGRFSASTSVQVAGAGGLLQEGSAVRDAFAERLRALGGVTLVDSPVDPVMGAVRIALRFLAGSGK